jgi:hypothetical protein
VTIAAGGLSYSEKVTVGGGSIARPCGTVPLNPGRFTAPAPLFRVPSSPSAAPASTPPAPPTPPSSPPISVSVPTPVAAHHVAHAPAPQPLPLSVPSIVPVAPALPVAPPSIVPPVTPSTARPAPPGGSAPVQQAQFSSVPAVKKAEQEEHAVQESFNYSTRADEQSYRGGGAPLIALLVVLAAGGGAAMRRPRRSEAATPAPVNSYNPYDGDPR